MSVGSKTSREALEGLGAWCSELRRNELHDLLCAELGPDYERRREESDALLSLFRDTGVEDSAIAEVIERDSELSAFLRARANRPFFGAVSRIESIDEMITILGREKVARLALVHALRRAFRPRSEEGLEASRYFGRMGRAASEHAVRVAVEAASRKYGGVDDVRALDVIYGRTLFVTLGEVVGVALAEPRLPTNDLFCVDAITDCLREVTGLGPATVSALVMLDWGASVELADDLAHRAEPGQVEDHIVDLMHVGYELARAERSMKDSRATDGSLLRLGFGVDEWDFLRRTC